MLVWNGSSGAFVVVHMVLSFFVRITMARLAGDGAKHGRRPDVRIAADMVRTASLVLMIMRIAGSGKTCVACQVPERRSGVGPVRRPTSFAQPGGWQPRTLSLASCGAGIHHKDTVSPDRRGDVAARAANI